MLVDDRLQGDAQQLLTRTAVAITACIVVAEVAAHLVDFGVYDLRVGLVNASSDDSLFSWIGAIAALAAAGAAIVHVVVAHSHRGEAAALVAILGFVFVDNRLHLHEHVRGWPIFYLPMLGAAMVLMWRIVANHAPEQRAMLVSGLAFLVASLVIHELGPPLLAHLGWGPGDWAYQIKIALKEATELTGWLLVAFALWATVRDAMSQGRPRPERMAAR